MPKYELRLVRTFPSTILEIWIQGNGEIWIQFCSYMVKYGSEKASILAYLTKLLERYNSFKLDWLQGFKVSFLSKTDCDRATCSEIIEKKFVKSTSFLKTCFLFLQLVRHRKSKPVTMFWKVAVSKNVTKELTWSE